MISDKCTLNMVVLHGNTNYYTSSYMIITRDCATSTTMKQLLQNVTC